MLLQNLGTFYCLELLMALLFFIVMYCLLLWHFLIFLKIVNFQVPIQLQEILEHSLTWEFDIFRLEDLSNKKPLQNLGMNLFHHFDVPNILNCDEKTLFNWLAAIEANYRPENTYHNSTHAADVMQVKTAARNSYLQGRTVWGGVS